MEAILNFLRQTGFSMISQNWLQLVMIVVACFLAYLAIVKKFEPLLLLPIAFGMLLTNLPGAEMYHELLFAGGHVHWDLFGGTQIFNSQDMVLWAANGYDAATQIFEISGNSVCSGNVIIGSIVGTLPEGAAFINAGGQVVSEAGKVLADNIAITASYSGFVVDGTNLMLGADVFAKNAYAIAPGLIDYLYLGVKLGLYPCLIFFGVGAMTDFGPLIANPKSLLLGAAAQLGIFMTYVGAGYLGFAPNEAASIGIIGGADGPTAIYVTSKLAPALLGPIAVAAYSYMALVPVIQPPIMNLLTTKQERQIVMKPLREVSRTEKVLFPFIVTIFVAFLVPSAAPLVGSLMLGNLFKESGVTERLSKTVQNELMNIVTIFLGISVGATATANTFLNFKTLGILALGIIAFSFGTGGGVLLAKFMNLFLKEKINPLIGSAGVSAVPMAARVSQKVGQKNNPGNFLLMHAMGPNVAGVIGSAIAAGCLIALFS